jgi:predicted Co/Zn/Cd cation transporter (cation efflux family)
MATVSAFCRRGRRGSDLIRAEAAEWVSDTLLSFGVLVGFVVALVLQQTGRSDLARYVDPVMVALISAAFLPVPLRLATQGLREILTMARGADLRQRLAGRPARPPAPARAGHRDDRVLHRRPPLGPLTTAGPR